MGQDSDFLGIMIKCTRELGWPAKPLLSRPLGLEEGTECLYYLCCIPRRESRRMIAVEEGKWRVGRPGLKKADFQPVGSDCEGHQLTRLFRRVPGTDVG